MCVLAFAWRAHPGFELVLAGNRDERHDRPAAPLARWAGAPHVLAGRDLSAGGGWLGVSDRGRLAVVTNVRGYGGPEPDRPSRGALVADVLTEAGRYADLAVEDLPAFNPMNLITVRGGEAVYWANRPSPLRRSLRPGVYGMANGGLDDGWPKTDRLKAALSTWLDQGGTAGGLLDVLMDEHRPRDNRLPATGLPLDVERTASAIFIRNLGYGTRCSSVVLVGAGGEGRFLERRFDEHGQVTGETELPFHWGG